MLMKTKNNYYTGNLFIVVLTVIVLLSAIPVNAQDWFDSNWEYRREVTVTNPVGSELTDFQIQITLDASFDFSTANSDGSDIRVTENDGTTALSFWVEYWDATGQQASIWVKAPTISISGTTFFLYYGNATVSSLSDGSATFEFFDDFEVDLTKWTASGGTWTTVETTEQGGTTGDVAQGTTTGIQLLQSIGYSGTDYVLDGYKKLISGREWGMCTRVTGSQSFYLSMLYEDLDATNNLYLYIWTPSAHPNQNTAVGTVNMNTWYKMTVKVYDDTVSTFIDDVEEMTVEDATHTSGGIALLGNNNTVAQFNDIRVRKYALIDPLASVGIEEIQPSTIDIAIYHTTCGDFEVKLRPLGDISSNYITNIQFTLKWPANTVNLSNFYSDFGVGLQGVYVENDTNYAIFVSAAYSAITWTAGNEYPILSLSHDNSAIDSADFIIENSTWASNNNGSYYVEVFGEDYTGIVYGNATNVYLGRCGEFKVFLQGAYETGGIMRKDLSANIPLSQPFNIDPWNYSGSESVAAIDASVVDWVLIELRSDENTLTEQKAALLLDNGQITQYNNISHGVHFDSTPDGSSFYIVVHHRNHMPVMTAVSTVFDGTLVDFTDETNCYGTSNAEIELETDIYGMIAGDLTANGVLQYSGPGNDRGPIISRIVTVSGSSNINGLITNGYWYEDANLNDTVLYIGSENDRSLININLNSLVGPALNNIYTSLVPGIAGKEQEQMLNNGSFDIQLAASNSEVVIEIVNNELLKNGLVDNIQFTLVWKADDPEIAEFIKTYKSDFLIEPQGFPIKFNDNIYQVFASVTATTLPQAFYSSEIATLLAFDNSVGIQIQERLWIADDEFTEQNNGMYYVSVWGKDNTGAIKSNPLAVNNNTFNNSIQLYPNPTWSGKTNLDLSLPEASNIQIEILDVHGKLLFTHSLFAKKGFSSNQIEFEELHSGIYYMNIRTNKLLITKKLIILK